MKKIILVIALVVLTGSNLYSAEKVFEYGFEDWTGDAATTPNYFSSTNYSNHWNTHILSTEVVGSECGGRSAFEGNYYFHQNFYTGALDPCLGTTPSSINPHTNIGFNGNYPPNPKNNFSIRNSISSNTMTIRFYFRTTGNWPNAVSNDMKFIRVYGNDSVSSSILHIADEGKSFDIYDHPHPDNPDPSWSDYHNRFTAPINWNDGQWHSVVMVVERLNDHNIAPNLKVEVWWDDWEMQDIPDGAAEVYVNNFDSSISHIALFVNWGATYPSSDMGIDLDKIEIWDGRPTDTIEPPDVATTDLNQDGVVNILDVQVAVNTILGTYNGNADCNNDGVVNIADVMMIVNEILGS